MRLSRTLLLSLALILAGTGIAQAADGHGPDWGNFLLRLLNLALVLFVLWKLAGKSVGGFFTSRKSGIEEEMAEAVRLKQEAEAQLAKIEDQVAHVEEECASLLASGKAQAESLKASIIAEAERQASQILEQARLSAAQEGKAELALIRAEMADQIVALVEKELKGRLDAQAQQDLIDKTLTKVVLQ